MILDEDPPLDVRDPLFIEMKPCYLEAFTDRSGPFLQYNRLDRHDISGLDFTPIYYEGRLGTGLLFRHEVLFFFDPDEFPIEDYGLPYGDKGFEKSASAYIEKVFPRSKFGRLIFAPQDCQGDDFISMEFDTTGLSVRSPSDVFRKTPAEASALRFSDLVSLVRTITNAEADQYYRAVSPKTAEDDRPEPPGDLFAGMWVRFDRPPSL